MRRSVPTCLFLASLVMSGMQTSESAASAADAPSVAPPAAPVGAAGTPSTKRPPPSRPTGNAAAGVLHEPLRTVDPGRQDVGALATSFRLEPLDLRVPTGFQRVYEVPGSDGELMRGNGALFAVFPRGSYRWVEGKAAPTVPPGTVFHFGMPGPSVLDLKPPATVEQGAIGARLNGRLTPVPVSDPASSSGARAEVRAAPVAAAQDDARFPAAAPSDPFAQLALGPSCVTATE